MRRHVTGHNLQGPGGDDPQHGKPAWLYVSTEEVLELHLAAAISVRTLSRYGERRRLVHQYWIFVVYYQTRRLAEDAGGSGEERFRNVASHGCNWDDKLAAPAALCFRFLAAILWFQPVQADP